MLLFFLSNQLFLDSPFGKKVTGPFSVLFLALYRICSQLNLVQRSWVLQGLLTLQLLHGVSNPLHPPGLKTPPAFCKVPVCALRARWIPKTPQNPDPSCCLHQSSPSPLPLLGFAFSGQFLSTCSQFLAHKRQQGLDVAPSFCPHPMCATRSPRPRGCWEAGPGRLRPWGALEGALSTFPLC